MTFLTTAELHQTTQRVGHIAHNLHIRLIAAVDMGSIGVQMDELFVTARIQA